MELYEFFNRWKVYDKKFCSARISSGVISLTFNSPLLNVEKN